MQRIIWIVLDSLGIGEMKDAKMYGDEAVNTLEHVYLYNQGLKIPNLLKLGLGNIEGIKHLPRDKEPQGIYARINELSKGKDTTTGHWEMVGIYTEIPFPTYPQGFPKDIVEAFETAIGREILGNCTASGTAILERLGEEHLKTGKPIVYTSADSVFQIAAHEEVISLEELYDMCVKARRILSGEHEVSRVIARPFVGSVGDFVRTPHRHDYAITPPRENLLVYAKEEGLDVIGIGKIHDIFNGLGITKSITTKDNVEGIQKTIEVIKQSNKGIIFTNLVDFDMKWGHRNDPKGYGEGLEIFDSYLPAIIDTMNEDDLLILTADHGCDPTTPGTDHTRESVPLLMYNKKSVSCDLGIRDSFADIGQTIATLFNLKKLEIGKSFDEVLRG